jgi:hypothetical protein
MGILDEAIKEHLELKRQHGAGESELKQLEDEAFGASERPGSEGSPDPLAEAPTQFMTQPGQEATESESAPEEPANAGRDESSEPPPAATAVEEAPTRGRTEIADLQEPPVESVDAAEEAPAEEPSPAMEHAAITEPASKEASPAEDQPPPDEPEPEPPAGPSTEERHAIAEHPTEMYDVEAELGDAEPAGTEPEVHALSEEDEEFWDEKRLSDELDQALEAPVELQEVDLGPEPAPAPPEDSTPEEDEAHADEDAPRPSAGHEDALEETPDFLEDRPEDDQLWFEQKPPKDFDFDD